MTNLIKIEVRNVYGNETIYPHCEAAKSFANIAGTKTLTIHTLRNVAALGFSIAVVDRYGQVSRIYTPELGRNLVAA